MSQQQKTEREQEVFGERVAASLKRENTGTKYHRIGIIRMRWLDSLAERFGLSHEEKGS